LTSAAIMLVTYAGYMALRKFVEDPEKRAVWSSVVGIIAAANLLILWKSVEWWNSLHQLPSTPQTIPDPQMKFSLRWNAIAFLCLTLAFVYQRYRLAQKIRNREVALPSALPPPTGATS
jgi:heme exporter protein C